MPTRHAYRPTFLVQPRKIVVRQPDDHPVTFGPCRRNRLLGVGVNIEDLLDERPERSGTASAGGRVLIERSCHFLRNLKSEMSQCSYRRYLDKCISISPITDINRHIGNDDFTCIYPCVSAVKCFVIGCNSRRIVSISSQNCVSVVIRSL